MGDALVDGSAFLNLDGLPVSTPDWASPGMTGASSNELTEDPILGLQAKLSHLMWVILSSESL